jgi:hypothetical protein
LVKGNRGEETGTETSGFPVARSRTTIRTDKDGDGGVSSMGFSCCDADTSELCIVTECALGGSPDSSDWKRKERIADWLSAERKPPNVYMAVPFTKWLATY